SQGAPLVGFGDPPFELSERLGGVLVWASDMPLSMQGPLPSPPLKGCTDIGPMRACATKTKSRVTARRPTAPIGVNFGLRMAECIAQCSNLEDELHRTASKLCILGFEPLKES